MEVNHCEECTKTLEPSEHEAMELEHNKKMTFKNISS